MRRLAFCGGPRPYCGCKTRGIWGPVGYRRQVNCVRYHFTTFVGLEPLIAALGRAVATTCNLEPPASPPPSLAKCPGGAQRRLAQSASAPGEKLLADARPVQLE